MVCASSLAHLIVHRRRERCVYRKNLQVVTNSPLLPLVSLLVGIALAIVVAISAGPRGFIPLSELELGGIAGALALVIFGVQGVLSVALEGTELRPGSSPPHLTNPLSAAMVIASLLLLIDALFLAVGIVSGWGTLQLGVAAGLGCLLVAALLLFYKEAFLGDEARFDDREDGVPW